MECPPWSRRDTRWRIQTFNWTNNISTWRPQCWLSATLQKHGDSAGKIKSWTWGVAPGGPRSMIGGPLIEQSRAESSGGIVHGYIFAGRSLYFPSITARQGGLPFQPSPARTQVPTWLWTLSHHHLFLVARGSLSKRNDRKKSRVCLVLPGDCVCHCSQVINVICVDIYFSSGLCR